MFEPFLKQLHRHHLLNTGCILILPILKGKDNECRGRMASCPAIVVCVSCHHPTIWTFLHGLKKDMQQQKLHFSKQQLALFINRVVNSAFWMNVLSMMSLHLDNRKYLFRPTYVLLLIFHTLGIFSSSQVSCILLSFFNCLWFYILFATKHV